jgi:hypothetical protein
MISTKKEGKKDRKGRSERKRNMNFGTLLFSQEATLQVSSPL